MKPKISYGRGQDIDPASPTRGVSSSFPYNGKQEDTFLLLLPVKCLLLDQRNVSSINHYSCTFMFNSEHPLLLLTIILASCRMLYSAFFFPASLSQGIHLFLFPVKPPALAATPSQSLKQVKTLTHLCPTITLAQNTELNA